jgi:hypothetical protein
VYDKQPECTFPDEWTPVNILDFQNKPLLWDIGVYDIGPTYAMDLSDPGDKFEWFAINESLGRFDVDAHMFMLRYEFSYNDQSETPYQIRVYSKKSNEKTTNDIYRTTKKFFYSIIEENETAEVLNKMIESDLKSLPWDSDIRFSYNYNSSVGNLDIQCNRHFQITHSSLDLNIFNQKSIVELLRFLNQEVTIYNYLKLITPSPDKTFHDNVWNRKRAMFHATFSNALRRYIGIRNDFWGHPTKFYSFNDNTTEFYVRFTTDGRHYFIPRYSGFIIELVYIINMENVEIGH